MFSQLARSRAAPQSVCISCLYTLYGRSDRRRRVRNGSTTAENPSIGDNHVIDLSRPNVSLDVNDRKSNETDSVLKENALGKVLLENPVAILESAFMKEDQANDAITFQTDSEKKLVPKKRKKKAFKGDIKSIELTKIPAADEAHNEVDGEENRSHKTDKLHDRELSTRGLPPNGFVSLNAKTHNTKLKGNQASETKFKIVLSSEQAQPNKRPTIRLCHSRSPPASKTIFTTKKASKTIEEVGELVRLTEQNLMTAIRASKLGSQDTRRLAVRLRNILLSGPIKTSALGEQANSESGSLQRAKKSRVVRGVNRKIKSDPANAKDASSKKCMNRFPGKMKAKSGMTVHEIETVAAADLHLVPIEKLQPPVPNLAYGLERVLFNPGVYHLRDPRSRVFNFDPYLESIMPVAEFDFNALKEYITSSRDETLISTATEECKKYTGSTSSMTSALAHFHFLLSQWRPVNISSLSQGFPEKLRTFTQLSRAPSALFLRWKNGTYAIDADKEFDTANILMMLGKSMEKLLTLPTQDFEKYRKQNSDKISKDERNEAESFHYTTIGDFLMRSQLDAYDPRIPGTGMFDLKTRAVVSIRMDARNYQNGLGYEIRNRHGEFESYEREYYDMIRAAFLKYSLQVRMGRMDGVFVAFHNTERIFGFQYISLLEMDFALHGQDNPTIGDSEFKLSLHLLNRILDRATAKFPEQSLRIFFETRGGKIPFMYIFAEPVTEDEIQRIQDSKKVEIEEYERTVLGFHRERTTEDAKAKDQQEKADWEELQAKVEESMDNDELDILDESETPDEVNDNCVVVDSEEHYSLSVLDKKPDSANSFSSECLPKLNSKVEEENGKAIDFEEQIRACIEHNGVKKTSAKEADLNAMKLTPGTRDVNEDSNNVVVDQLTDGDLVGERSDVANTDDQKHEETSRSKADLLAMTLTIRNQLNGVYIVRPEKMNNKDRWSVEYALAEVPKQDQARSLYEKTQRRRAMILERDKNEVKTSFQGAYTRKLSEISLQGRKWRREQNEIDLTESVKVLGYEPAEAQPASPP